jgi:16S rRNA (adenine1518-N6/adenine1519-N6)-dimethyltransferase
MGQNFLIDNSVPERIACESGIDENCGVLEIGPGVGCLTSELAKRAGRVLAVEIDKRLIPVLEESLSGFENIDIINADAMRMDISETVRGKFVGLHPVVCANIPYNITSPLITKLIKEGLFEKITVMVQREVAKRICAEKGTADYGSLTVYVNYYYEPSILFDVPPGSFFPQPKVFSSVVTMTRRDPLSWGTHDEKLFFRTVRAVFERRRKTLVNSLLPAFGGEIGKDGIESAVSACGFDPLVRGETLGTPEFIRLTAALEEMLPR